MAGRIGGLASAFIQQGDRQARAAFPVELAKIRSLPRRDASAGKGVDFRRVARRTTDHLGDERAHVARQAAMGYVLERLVNYGKLNGPWTDRTTNLRNSYRWEIVRDGRFGVRGYFANIAAYAVWVEFKPRYWVLSGAIKAELPTMNLVLAATLRDGATTPGAGSVRGGAFGKQSLSRDRLDSRRRQDSGRNRAGLRPGQDRRRRR
jgi:hypothetical protein